ncbi:MAG: homocysteine S-methyltransferase [Flavobacteriales bacterium]|nr:homocysteine S-methyltransferase [Flavobacteriales bacterium]
MTTKIKYPLILDGGLSNVLESFGCDLNQELWSAKMLIDQPELIKRAHLAYLEAGAQCITSSSYQATLSGFERIGLNRSDATKMMIKSIELADEARSVFIKKNNQSESIFLAASIGPYGAFLADGSEYRGDYRISDNELRQFHAEKIHILESTNVDFLAFETIPSLQEIQILSELISQSKKQCWISFSCRDSEFLNDGSKIIDALKICSSTNNLFALGVNCTAPKYISSIIKKIRPLVQDKKIIIYPNSGEIYLPESKSWKGISDPDIFQKMASEWLDLGVDIIGGCCRIGPDHITKLSQSLGNYTK